jgi:hypothetical protein
MQQRSSDEIPLSLRGLQDSNSYSVPSNEFATKVVPAVILSIAIFIIMCTLSQYACDLYTRLRLRHSSYNDSDEHEFDRQVEEGKRSLTTAAASHSNASDNDSQNIHRRHDVEERVLVQNRQIFNCVPRMLPPLPTEINELEDMISPLQESLSRVSTLTNSLIEGAMSFGESGSQNVGGKCSDQRRSSTEAAEEVTELSAAHRLPQEGNISNLMRPTEEAQHESPESEKEELPPFETRDDKMNISTTSGDVKEEQDESRDELASACSSLTAGTPSEATGDESLLHGEECLKEEGLALEQLHEPPSFLSLERSPDTRPSMGSVGRDIDIVGRLLFCEGDDGGDGMDHNVLDLYESAVDDFSQSEHSNEKEEIEDSRTHSDCNHPNSSASPIDLVSPHDFTREIYFVAIPRQPCPEESKPSPGKNDAEGSTDALGLQLLDASCEATHPSVAVVLPSSPLLGRIFEGDFILKVNGLDVSGYSCEKLGSLLLEKKGSDGGEDETQSTSSGHLSYQMINLTIMSSRCDRGWDEESSDGSFDLGVQESGVEL